MHKHGDEVHIDDTEASGGSKEGVVRWILIAGTLLAIVLLSVIWITGAATQDDVESEVTATGKLDAMAEENGDDTDSIVGDETVETETVTAD